MTYAELTEQQKNDLQQVVNFSRAAAAELAKIGRQGRAVAAAYFGNVENILALLGENDLVPNVGGLSGAQAMTKAELVILIGYLSTVSETGDNVEGAYNSNFHRGLFAKAAGINAMA